MEFEAWEPIYERIREEFGFQRENDEYARDVLKKISPKFRVKNLTKFEGAKVMIVGGARCIKKELYMVEEVDKIIAVSTAADVLLEEGVKIDMMVTDLDKNPGTSVRLSKRKIPVAIAAHGDNIECLRKWVPKCDLNYVIGTTQVEPIGNIVNYGGFTDGDRAAFLGDVLGADEIIFAGWDFDDRLMGVEKKRKLKWAEFLLLLLEEQRGQKFNVLEGRREKIISMI
jgi:uncharacterized Rossmann fold enzyme